MGTLLHGPAARFLAAVLGVSLAGSASAQTAVNISYLEGTNPVAPDAVTAWGPDMFGDKVNLFNGSLSFEHTDMQLPGNSQLPVALTRSYVAGRSDVVRGQLGRWDLEVPRIGGTFSWRYGWVTASGGVNRCTGFSLPPVVSSSGSTIQNSLSAPGSLTGSKSASPISNQPAPAPLAATAVGFIASDYWQGTHIVVPGQGSQEVLKRSIDYVAMPQDGLSYPLLTRNNWQISCLGSIQNAAGEGFVAVSPDGVRYRFDWMAWRPQADVKKSGASIGRADFFLMATEVRDRFGNWVRYAFDPANPYLLTEIRASDGRQITIANSGGRAVSASDGTRTFSYGYDAAGELRSVALPDGSSWALNLAGLTASYLGDMGEGANCDNPGALPADDLTGTMTHPSGAVGTFSMSFMLHGRTYVDRYCKYASNSKVYTTGSVYPRWVGTQSLTAKTISGPGMATQTWGYRYSSAAGWNPCTGCADRKTVIVTEPDGTYTVSEFGNRWRVNEGQLLRVSQGWTGSGYLKVTDMRYRAAGGQNYPEQFGTSLLPNSDWLASRNRPMDQRVITQQGGSFTWQAAADAGGFDTFTRPLQVNRFSSLGHSRTETTRYKDFPELWVNGQKEAVWLAPAGGLPVEAERHDYLAALGLKSASYAFGLKTRAYAYNADGTLATLFDTANRPILFQDFMRGKPQRAVFADGSVASRVVNNLGNVAASTNEAGTTTHFSFDAMGRVASITPPLGNLTFQGFEPVAAYEFGLPPGHWRQTISVGTAVTRRYFDAQWRVRLLQKFDSDDLTGAMSFVETRYDAKGRKSFESYPQPSFAQVDDPAVPGRYFDHDALDRPTVQRADSELGVLTTTTQYLGGFQKQVTNPRGYATTYLFQAFDAPAEDHISQMWTPDAGWLTIARDVFGTATSISRGGTFAGAAQKAVRYYIYDAHHRLCKTVEPETGATVQAYDAAGNVAWRASGLTLPGFDNCDQDSVPATRMLSFGYDARDRLTTTTFGDGQPGISRSYTPDGLLQQLVSSSFTWTYSYDPRRLLTQEAFSVPAQTPGTGWNFTYTLDGNGHVAALTDPWGTTNYSPNAFGQPRQVSGYASGVKYHANGMVSDYTLANGITHRVTQNKRGLPWEWQDGSVNFGVYSYDANGNTAAITDALAGQNRSMGYDALDRLAVANGVWGSGSYSYDALDNLRSSQVGGRSLAHVVDPVTNRLTALSGSQQLGFAYDANGNVIQRGGQTYSFDIANRMRVAQGKASYDYDGHGRRSWVVFANGSTQLNAYGGTGAVGQLLFSNHSSKGGTRYVYLGGKLIAEHNNLTGLSYSHTDALGSVVAHSNAAGQVQGAKTRYEPYGATALGDVPQSIGFTGHVNDPDTGLVYMQQRYYEPLAGRFLSVDPVVTDEKSGGHFNRYVYANNNPFRFVDPDGREPGCGYWSCQLVEYKDVVKAFSQAVDSTITGGEGMKFSASLAQGDMSGAALHLAAGVGYGLLTAGSFPGRLGMLAATGVRAGEAGAFGSLKGVKGDGLTAHHMPQAAAERTGYNEGGALVMTQAEHVATRTYGSKGVSTLRSDAGLSFRDVLARDIRDVRSIVGSKYNQGLRDLTDYYRRNFPDLMGK